MSRTILILMMNIHNNLPFKQANKNDTDKRFEEKCAFRQFKTEQKEIEHIHAHAPA